MYEILFKWGLDTFREALGNASKEELAFTLEAVKAKNAMVQRRFEVAVTACSDLIALSNRIDAELKSKQEAVRDAPEAERYTRFIGAVRNELHPSFLREYRKLKGKFIVSNDLLAGYALVTTEIVQYRQFEAIAKSLGCQRVSQAASLYRALWEHLVHLLTTMVRLTSSDMRFWLTDSPYMQTAELFAAYELGLARSFFSGADHRYYRCLLEDPGNLEKFWLKSTTGLLDTYAQPSPTTTAMAGIMSLPVSERSGD
jgi:hypothetical protein